MLVMPRCSPKLAHERYRQSRAG